jgi:hypothetical protein
MRDTIDMAREAGFPMAWISDNDGGVIRWKDIKAFEALVRADEREACAKQLNALGNDHCATAIRARGQG